MELLVNNKIVSLDLPVADVYKKIWCAERSEVCKNLTKKYICESYFVKNVLQTEPMRVVYRMRGLLGDATEDMVNTLDSGKGV